MILGASGQKPVLTVFSIIALLDALLDASVYYTSVKTLWLRNQKKKYKIVNNWRKFSWWNNCSWTWIIISNMFSFFSALSLLLTFQTSWNCINYDFYSKKYRCVKKIMEEKIYMRFPYVLGRPEMAKKINLSPVYHF